MSEEQSSKEAYDAKKAEREKQKEGKEAVVKRNNSTKSLVRWIIALVILGGIGFWFYTLVAAQLPQGEDVSNEYEILGRNHITDQDPLPEYNSNPPSSGDHSAETAQTGFYEPDEIISDLNFIHNLEHGDIWISYDPAISEAAREQLRTFAAAKVIVAPRIGNDHDVAVVAWGHVDSFDLEGDIVPTQRIQDFISRYINRGPERVNVAPGVGHRQ